MDNILTKDQQDIVDRLRYCLQHGYPCTLGADELHIPMNAIEQNASLTAQLAASREMAEGKQLAIEILAGVETRERESLTAEQMADTPWGDQC
jgi:hypothetical protein